MRYAQSTEFLKETTEKVQSFLCQVFSCRRFVVDSVLSFKVVFFWWFQLFLACTSLSFESVRFVRKLGPVRWKLSCFRQELLSESLLQTSGGSFSSWLIARITGEHQSCCCQVLLIWKILMESLWRAKISDDVSLVAFQLLSHSSPDICRKSLSDGSLWRRVISRFCSLIRCLACRGRNHIISSRFCLSKHVWRTSSSLVEVCTSDQRKDGSCHSRGWIVVECRRQHVHQNLRHQINSSTFKVSLLGSRTSYQVEITALNSSRVRQQLIQQHDKSSRLPLQVTEF